MVEMFQDQAKAKGIKLSHSVVGYLHITPDRFPLDQTIDYKKLRLPALLGDEIRLQQVLINLIKNALKFTLKGFIEIASSYNFIENKLTVHVRDSGCGISEKDLQKLFKRFGKLPGQKAEKLNKEGIGLGLAICEAIISQNGGSIKVFSQGEGHGTVFMFDIDIETVPFDELSQVQENDNSNSHEERVQPPDPEQSIIEERLIRPMIPY